MSLGAPVAVRLRACTGKTGKLFSDQAPRISALTSGQRANARCRIAVLVFTQSQVVTLSALLWTAILGGAFLYLGASIRATLRDHNPSSFKWLGAVRYTVIPITQTKKGQHNGQPLLLSVYRYFGFILRLPFGATPTP